LTGQRDANERETGADPRIPRPRRKSLHTTPTYRTTANELAAASFAIPAASLHQRRLASPSIHGCPRRVRPFPEGQEKTQYGYPTANFAEASRAMCVARVCTVLYVLLVLQSAVQYIHTACRPSEDLANSRDEPPAGLHAPRPAALCRNWRSMSFCFVLRRRRSPPGRGTRQPTSLTASSAEPRETIRLIQECSRHRTVFAPLAGGMFFFSSPVPKLQTYTIFTMRHGDACAMASEVDPPLLALQRSGLCTHCRLPGT
jgi:hypothetical protein